MLISGLHDFADHTRGYLGRWWLAASLTALICLGGAGCAKPLMDTPNPIEIDAREYRRMYHASVLALREQGFRVGRQDYRFGRVSTYPLAAETGLEPWYSSNTSLNQALESTLNQQRRIATVLWEPVIEPGTVAIPWEATKGQQGQAYRMRVEVLVERRQAPGRHLSGSTRGHSVMASLSSIPVEWVNRGITSRHYWQPLGRDPLLEQRIIAAIVRKSLTLKLPPIPAINSPPQARIDDMTP